MTGLELKEIRTQLGLTQRGLAEALKMSGENARRTVRRWEKQTTPIPGSVTIALRYLLLEHQS